MKDHPLAEVFGFQTIDDSKTAEQHRTHQLCRFNNVGPNCTKDKKDNPLGVCSIYHNNQTAIVCPIRFRENWAIAVDAAEFFFPKGSKWTALSEIKLCDINGKSVGKIDHVLVSYDSRGITTDYGALFVQAMNYTQNNTIASLRVKMLECVSVFSHWGKKTVIAMNRCNYESLSPIYSVSREHANVAWIIYDLVKQRDSKLFELKKWDTIYDSWGANQTISGGDWTEAEACFMHHFHDSDENFWKWV